MLAPLPLPNVVGCRAVDPKCCAEYRKRRWRKFRRANKRYSAIAAAALNAALTDDVEYPAQSAIQMRQTIAGNIFIC